jgi:hypothetical protein
MFYDVDTPRQFISDIAGLLKPDGVWINQMNFVGPVMRANAFDFCSHEHIALWDFPTFVNAVAEVGLEVFDLEELPLNGGTYRIYIDHRNQRRISPRVYEYQAKDAEYNSVHAWLQFRLRVTENGHLFRALLTNLNRQGKIVTVLGASTRGNSLLQAYGLSVADFPYASDRDPNKWGRMMAGTNIPIVSEEEARERKPDYFLVLPYSYIEQIARREAIFLGRGGHFIVPLPVAKILN